MNAALVHSVLCTPHVSPHPDTGLTYIPRAAWDRVMQMALKPDQLAAQGTKSSPELRRPSPDWGFHALHHFLDVHLLYPHIKAESCQIFMHLVQPQFH